MTLTKKNLCTSLLITAALGTSINTAWADDSLEERITILENQAAQSTLLSDKNMSTKIYATIRPSLTYFNEEDNNRTEVTDFLSFAGIYSEAELGGGWTAMAHGEWGLDIAKDGDFGAARRASLGISSSTYGKVTFGKDRAVDYLLHATYLDIFNHRASPFAYDQIGKDAFFTPNQVSYANSWDSITFMTGFKFRSGNDVDYAEQSIVGLGYDKNDLHLAVSFKSTDAGVDDNVETVAVSYAQHITGDFYLAAMYQDEEEIATLDVSLAYRLNDKYKIKAAYYNFDDGVSTTQSVSNDGFNLTLERQFTPKFRTHVEVLTKNYDNFADETAVTIGFKYDLAILWKS